MRVPFVDLIQQYEPLKRELMNAFEGVLDSGTYVQGRQVSRLEEEFEQRYGVKHALATSNGTTALHLALLGCGIGPGDEVITVANTFIATAEAITMVGATPVFVDIEGDGFNVDPSAIEAAITPRTRAIIVVHLYGQIAAMPAVLEIARRNKLRVIEDACQAFGAMREGTLAGTFGDVGCLSFYPTKNLGTLGEGGMLLTGDDEVAARAAQLRDHGQDGRHNHVVAGFNYRLPELQAAALRVFLPWAMDWNRERRLAAKRYERHLGACESIVTPTERGAGSHVYHLYVIRSTEREALRRHLDACGIATAIHYPTPIHKQPAYMGARGSENLARTERAVGEILSLPMHPTIQDEEIDYVCAVIRAFERERMREGMLEATLS